MAVVYLIGKYRDWRAYRRQRTLNRWITGLLNLRDFSGNLILLSLFTPLILSTLLISIIYRIIFYLWSAWLSQVGAVIILSMFLVGEATLWILVPILRIFTVWPVRLLRSLIIGNSGKQKTLTISHWPITLGTPRTILKN